MEADGRQPLYPSSQAKNDDTMVMLTPSVFKFSRVGLVAICVIFLLLSIAIIVMAAVLLRSGVVADSNTALLILEKITIDHDITVAYMMKRISIGILVVGIILMFKSLLGLVGTFGRFAAFVVIFILITIILSGFQIFVLYIWFELNNEFDDYAKAKMLGHLALYNGNATDALTKSWNNLFVWFDCCGVHAQSQVNDVYLYSAWGIAQATQVNNTSPQKIPGFCCKGATDTTGMSQFGKPCTTRPNATVAYFNSGCYDKLDSYFESFTAGIVTVGFIYLLSAFLAVILGIILTYDFAVRNKKIKTEVALKQEPPLTQENDPNASVYGPGALQPTYPGGYPPWQPDPNGYPPFPYGGYPPYPPFHPMFHHHPNGYPPLPMLPPPNPSVDPQPQPIWRVNTNEYPPFHPMWHPEAGKNPAFQPIWHVGMNGRYPYYPDRFGYFNGPSPTFDKLRYYNGPYYRPEKYGYYDGLYPMTEKYGIYNGSSRYLPITYFAEDDDREVQKSKKKKDQEKYMIYEDGRYRSAPSRPYGRSSVYYEDPYFYPQYYGYVDRYADRYADRYDRYDRNRRSSRYYWYPDENAYYDQLLVVPKKK